ncbi:MAG: hypothetical protein K9N46_01845 [Candidatus Marinimicrobia bacterium]|nr:hypothetical protein [Candidatus Neomarinimicrobiota bacterium]MCF7827780.1 hypothetical protein [Candidatus Neomarinimicrobiota bacterium]MCF7879465.1 hypothetical protein [Candidatus Neomarinimicrobiota bacterium]
MNSADKRRSFQFNRYTLLSIFLVSVTLVGLQLFLMRALSVVRYHHFSYLVISTALLGFGVSGTFLAFFYERMKSRFAFWVPLFYLVFLISIPVSYLAAQSLPIDTRYVLFSARQQLLMLLYNLLILLPFFFGAVIVGAAISYFRKEVSTLYAADLLGSGIGGMLAVLAMFFIPAIALPLKLALTVLIGLLCLIFSSPVSFFGERKPFTFFLLGAGIIVTGISVFLHPLETVDQYKALANFQRLEAQGDATPLIQEPGPRARIDVYQSERVHQTLFAGLQSQAMPPAQFSLLMDGGMAGTIFTVDSLDETAILDYTPQSVPYRLTENPKVLLLGEVGGTNAWLARRFGAESITVVQTNPQLTNLMKNEFAGESGRIYLKGNVTVINEDPRLFLEQTEEQYDIIQIAGVEGMSAGVSGLQSLHENYLLTVEGIAQCIKRLTPDGLLSITRGIQSPPRDNIKIFATFYESLESSGVESPEYHMLQSRNYLAANTILAKSRISTEQITAFRAVCDSLIMDAGWFPGISGAALEQRNKIAGPEGESYSYLHHAAGRIIAGNAKQFYQNWAYNVRPATDEQPYFFNFFKWSSVDQFMETYGRQWLQRLELGYAVLVITLIEVSLIAFVLILLPLFFRNRSLPLNRTSGWTLLHFAGIGFGFMFLEMVYIQRFTKFMGDPIYSVAAALTAILVFAGLGSASQRRINMPAARRIQAAGIGLLAIAGLYLLGLDSFLNLFIGFGTAVRFLVTFIALFPLAFCMGWFFPAGIEILENRSEPLIPWAWGINGFASVVAAPLGVMLSMEFGFTVTMGIALGCYGIVVVASIFWNKSCYL